MPKPNKFQHGPSVGWKYCNSRYYTLIYAIIDFPVLANMEV